MYIMTALPLQLTWCLCPIPIWWSWTAAVLFLHCPTLTIMESLWNLWLSNDIEMSWNNDISNSCVLWLKQYPADFYPQRYSSNFLTSHLKWLSTKQNKTKQNKTKQNKTKQNKTKQNKTKQNKTKQKHTNNNSLVQISELSMFSTNHVCYLFALLVV